MLSFNICATVIICTMLICDMVVNVKGKEK